MRSRLITQEPILELVHPRIGKHEGGIVLYYHGCRGNYSMSFLLKKFRKVFRISPEVIIATIIRDKYTAFWKNTYLCSLITCLHHLWQEKEKYKYNPKTLSYELQKNSLRFYLIRVFVLLPISLVVALGYYLVYTEGFKLKTPRLVKLEREYENAQSGLELLNKQMTQAEKRLENLQLRDNNIYRNIFGMEQIPGEVRNAGFGGSNRYPHLEYVQNSKLLLTTALSYDRIMKKAYIQSKS